MREKVRTNDGSFVVMEETYKRPTRVLSTETWDVLKAEHADEEESDIQLALAAIAVGAMASRDSSIVLVLMLRGWRA